MKTFQSCIIFSLLLLVGLAEPVSAFANAQPTENYLWPLKQQLQAPDPDHSDLFGFSVAVDRNIAVIGAPFDDEYGEDAGAAYVFRSEDGEWEFEQKLHAEVPYTDDHFGKYVSVSGSTAMIGSKKKGTVYFFERSPLSITDEHWFQTHKFHSTDGPVSVDGDIALVGDPSYQNNQGRVVVYTRSDGVWTKETDLIATNAAAVAEDRFGCSVSVSGETALIGACNADSNAGAAYVFAKKSGLGWVQQAQLLNDGTSGSSGGRFGHSVSLDDGTALIGAPFDDTKGEEAGAAYIFIRKDGGWEKQQKLYAADAVPYQHFGSSVSLDGENDSPGPVLPDSKKALIGAQWFNVQNAVPGSAYIFTRVSVSWGPAGEPWEQEYKIPHHGIKASFFGWSVSLFGNIAFVGAHTDNSDFSGSVYVFRRNCPFPILLFLPSILKH